MGHLVEKVRGWWKSFLNVLSTISIEPVFFLDGFAFSIMIVLVESIQFDKICQVNLGYNSTVCDNFSDYPEEKRMYDEAVGSFKRNDGAITSVIPLFFILFIGAWSDKYGRKIPLCLTLFAHILFSGGYLLNAIFFNIPVEYLYIVGFLDSIGGGPVAFLTVSNAYISDVTNEEVRTSRVALANSLWFLGGPCGTLLGTQIYRKAGYTSVFGTSLILYIIAILYVLFLLPESYGPFADKERLRKISNTRPTIRLRDTIIRLYGISKKKRNALGQTPSEEKKVKDKLTVGKMIKDFFDVKRVLLSFKNVFRKREGWLRVYICLLILSNFLRKIGRGAYAFYFTKEVLQWDAKDYGYWVTYKNLLSTLGSLFAVPILSKKMEVSDNKLAMIGSLSSVADYVLYGFVSTSASFLMWLAPAAALLINSCSIAMRAMMSKYVNPNELGQVSAVTGTMEGVVPVISTSLYSAITTATFETFPSAQYFFGAACNVLMALLFIIIIITDKGGKYDVESSVPKEIKGPVVDHSIVMKKDSNWLFENKEEGKVRLATILLTAMNFSIEVPSIERTYSTKEPPKKGRDNFAFVDDENIKEETQEELEKYKENKVDLEKDIEKQESKDKPEEELNSVAVS